MIGVLNLLAFYIGKIYSLEVGRTMAFVSLGMLELTHSFNIRSEESFFKAGFFKNKYLGLSFLAGTFLQIIVVVVPTFANIFELTNLTLKQWLITMIISFMPIILIEVQKAFNNVKFGRVVRMENSAERGIF